MQEYPSSETAVKILSGLPSERLLKYTKAAQTRNLIDLVRYIRSDLDQGLVESLLIAKALRVASGLTPPGDDGKTLTEHFFVRLDPDTDYRAKERQVVVVRAEDENDAWRRLGEHEKVGNEELGFHHDLFEEDKEEHLMALRYELQDRGYEHCSNVAHL